jgi:hypothetical protein
LPGEVVYKGDGVVRHVSDEHKELSFDVLYNSERDNKPGAKPTKELPPKPNGPDDCRLCKFVIQKDSSIYKTDKYVVGPNGFPINRYHTLITLNKLCPDAAIQGVFEPGDFLEMIDYSSRSGQFLISNTFGAAATQWHKHFQGFTYDVPISKLEVLPLTKGSEIHTMDGYVGANFVFIGRDRVSRAVEYTERIKNMGDAYTSTVLIKDDVVTVIPRRAEYETPACTEKRIGGFECAGVFVVGTKFDENNVAKVSGKQIFFDITYKEMYAALKDAVVPWEQFKGWYEPHSMWAQPNCSLESDLDKFLEKHGGNSIQHLEYRLQELQKTKWHESEKAGYDVGFEKTLESHLKERKLAMKA